jgi:choline-sulfatase
MPNLNRRAFLRAGLGALPAVRALAADRPRSARPNILVILTDDHGQWAQHAYGNSELRTPNLDRLAASGVRMDNAFTTCPVCSPARASFFTGRMPSQHGIHDYIEPKYDFTHPGLTGQRLISEWLQAAGYRTGLVGKWHCGRNREPKPGFNRWFSHYFDQYPHFGAQRFSGEGRLVRENGRQSDLLSRRAVDFIRQARTDQPYFLFVSYVDTHSPHEQAPEDLVALYRDATFRDIRRESLPPCHGRVRMGVNKDPKIERHRREEYYGAVSSIDRLVGELIDAVADKGELDNTLLVYTGDHGLNCGQHGIWEKGNSTWPQNFLEESVRIACTVSWPNGGVRRGATCPDFVNHCDLWATLLDAAGAAPSGRDAAEVNSPGRSYLERLRGESRSDWRRTIVSEYGNARMARTARYKLIRRYPFQGYTYPDELYDLQEDPRETANRSGDEALRSVQADLGAEIDRFFAAYSIPGRTGLELERQARCADPSPWFHAPPV